MLNLLQMQSVLRELLTEVCICLVSRCLRSAQLHTDIGASHGAHHHRTNCG